MRRPWAVEALTTSHAISEFHCGMPSVDTWLHEKALEAQGANRVRTHVCVDAAGTVQAFFALTFVIVSVADASARLQKAVGTGEASGLLVAQMGVHQELHGRGLGRAVMCEVFWTAHRIGQQATFPLLVVDAENSTLVPFYEQFGFQLVDQDRRLVMKMSAVRKICAALKSFDDADGQHA